MKKLLLSALIMALTITTIYSGVSFTNGLTHYASAASFNASESLAFLPNSDVVMIFDLNRFLGTKLFESVISDQKSKKEFEEFEQKAAIYGFNMRQIQSVAVGVSVNHQSPSDSKFCAVVTGGFDREKLLSAIASNPDKVTIESEEYQGRTIYLFTDKEKQSRGGGKTVKVDEKIAATFLNSQTVALGTLEKVKDSIDVQNGKQTSVASNQQLSNYISTTNRSAILRFAAVIPEKQKPASQGKKSKALTNDDLSNSPNASKSASSEGDGSPFGNVEKLLEAIQGAYGSLDFVSGVQLETTALIRSESEAKQISDALNGLLFLGRSALQGDPKQASLAKVLDGVVISGGLKDVRLNINISEPLLNELIKSFSQKEKTKN
ncbi:MAG: hypothetical protein HY819_19595 [Acidobacteria bacterium]|nr:hypothetical protein [Acidobacteriota bacterium]